MSQHQDLTAPEGIESYLQTHGYASCVFVERLTGGSSGFVYRAQLDEGNDCEQLCKTNRENT
jgi:hypothetical protein